MSDFSTNLKIPYLMPAQAQKHVTVNEALRRLDALVHMKAQSRTVTEQPAAPGDGQLWIVPPGKSGDDWDLFGNHTIAYYRDGAWEQVTPSAGWFAFVADEGELAVFDGAGWETVGVAGTQDVFVTVETDSGGPVSADTTLETLGLAGGAGIETAGDDALKVVTIALADTAVAPGAYGGAGKYLGLTVDAQGRVTTAEEGDLGALAARDLIDAPALLEAGVVSLAKQADLDAAHVIGRADGAGTGAPQALTGAELRAIANVEDGATADMSGAQIKAAYEGEPDTNAFDDAAAAALAQAESRLAAVPAAGLAAPADAMALQAMAARGLTGADLYFNFEAGLYARRGRAALLPALAPYARSGAEWGLNRWGELTSFAEDAPPVLRGRGLNCHGAHANLLKRSGDLSAGRAYDYGMTVAADALAAPGSGETFYRLQESAASGARFRFRQSVSLSPDTTYTAMIHVPAAGWGTRDRIYFMVDEIGAFLQRIEARIDLRDGTVGAFSGAWVGSAKAGLIPVAAGVNLAYVTFTTGSLSASGIVNLGWGPADETNLPHSGEGSDKYVLAWGEQLKTGAAAARYIPTEASAATVDASNFTIPWVQPGAFSFATRFVAPPDLSGARRLLRTDMSGGAQSDAYFEIAIEDGELRGSLVNGGPQWANAEGGGAHVHIDHDAPIAAGQTYWLAGRIARDDCAVKLTGASLCTDASAAPPAPADGLDEIDIGHWNGADHWGGAVRELALFSEALTDAEIAALTG